MIHQGSKFTVSVLFAVLLLNSSLAVAAGATLKVTGSQWIPYMDEDLRNGGLAADLVRTALENAGYIVEPSIEPWPRALRGVTLGEYDVAAAIWQSDARSKDILFSEPYLYNDVVFVSRKGAGIEFVSLDDLAGLSVGVVEDYTYGAGFDDHPEFERLDSDHLVQNLLLLRLGKLDLVIGDKWSIFYQLSRYLPDDISEFELLPKPLARRALRLGVSRRNEHAQEVVADFDAAIQVMREDGNYAEIVEVHTRGITVLPASR